eukprot:CAMPEP_0179152242 /NCGR_PEP_ID=MMETSP0796-20121207/73972_1 /TAXON_ID=73915 /ORGANISM="Pyrodinium bahamense, Strain pbaha01" /LENGTH=586 /DNA_ID=CAMNT_0020853433 /DNA_START=48 /DNA_END=1808 /DNA_ORIENTATION=-
MPSATELEGLRLRVPGARAAAPLPPPAAGAPPAAAAVVALSAEGPGPEDDRPGHHPSVAPATNTSGRKLVVDLHERDTIALGVLSFSSFAVLALLCSQLLHHAHISWLPESIMLITMGSLLGLAFREVYGFHSLQDYFGQMNVIALNVLLLPPIIFESGWSLRRQDFLSQLEYITIFAVFGTLLSTLTVCAILKQTGMIESWHVAFTYASLISATDPVATLSTYSALQVEPLLNIMVFGESTINDAVAIALFKAGNEHTELGAIVSNICYMLLGSPFVGLLVGVLLLGACLAVRAQDSEGPATLAICMSAWFCYGVAESMHLSGIIATLFCGLFLAAYLGPELSPGARNLLTFQLRQQAALADMSIFMLVGVFVILLGSSGRLGFCLLVGFSCLVGRAVAVFPLGLLVNWLKRRRARDGQNTNELTPAHLAMMWHAGLRGGIAMALCLEIDAKDSTEVTRDTLQEATFFVICVFLLLFGGTTERALQRLGIPLGAEMPEDVLCKDGGARFVASASRGTSIVYSAACHIMAAGGMKKKATELAQRHARGRGEPQSAPASFNDEAAGVNSAAEAELGAVPGQAGNSTT